MNGIDRWITSWWTSSRLTSSSSKSSSSSSKSSSSTSSFPTPPFSTVSTRRHRRRSALWIRICLLFTLIAVMALIKRFKNEEKTKDAVEIVEKYPRNRGVGGEMKAAGKMASKWFGAGSQLELDISRSLGQNGRHFLSVNSRQLLSAKDRQQQQQQQQVRSQSQQQKSRHQPQQQQQSQQQLPQQRVSKKQRKERRRSKRIKRYDEGHIAELGEVPAYTNFGDQEDSGEEFEDASQEEEEEEEGEEEEREFSADVKKIEESHGELNCSPPAFQEFPTDLFSQEERRQGAIALHIICVCFMFLGLAVVCDDYFVPALEKICERLNLSDDVAGATFMAAGSSAPELFTSIIGVFVAKGDVGTGTIVGSAVFNILFVVGICGLCCGQAVQLTWWPLFRDSTFYAISVMILLICIYDSKITWWESLIMLSVYLLYIVIMKFNTHLQEWVSKRTNKSGDSSDAGATTATATATGILPPQDQRKYYGNYEVMKEEEEGGVAPSSSIPMKQMNNGPPLEQLPTDEVIKRSNRKVSWSDMALRVMMGRQFRGSTRFAMAARVIIAENQHIRHKMSHSQSWRRKRYSSFRQLSRESDANSCTKAVRNDSWQAPLGLPVDQEEVVFHEWLKVPSLSESGILGVIKWVICFPLNVLFYYTVPDCRKKRWENFFMLGFFMAIFWIAMLSYVMVWMVCLIGFTAGIPDSVMGITFLAAGTSIPDAMASLIVARQGQGDMAVSNSIGSNVFDILIGLALPWFLTTAIVHPGSVVEINSNGLIFSISLLFFTVIFTLVAVHFNHWTLDVKLGCAFMVVYVIFLILSTLIEMNVFGYVNKPMCMNMEGL